MSAPLRVVLATRNAGKVREIREIFRAWPSLDLVGLEDVGLPESPEEAGIEAYGTFEENALAKARWFAARTGEVTLADDSGIAVDALGGAPGVHSRRFATGADLRGEAQDEANNRLLVERLAGKTGDERAAHYVCVAAVAWPDGREAPFRGTCGGVILPEPRGTGGFGYDPLFYVPSEGMTFGELPAARKNELSHRGKAIRAAAEHLSREAPGGG